MWSYCLCLPSPVHKHTRGQGTRRSDGDPCLAKAMLMRDP